MIVVAVLILVTIIKYYQYLCSDCAQLVLQSCQEFRSSKKLDYLKNIYVQKVKISKLLS